MEAVAAIAAFVCVLIAAGWSWGDELSTSDLLYRQATTACLTTIVLMQVVNVHLCRSDRASLCASRVLGNRLITGGIVAELVVIVLIDYTSIGNRLFGTAPLPLSAWVAVIPFALGMLGLEELRKSVVRGKLRGPSRRSQPATVAGR